MASFFSKDWLIHHKHRHTRSFDGHRAPNVFATSLHLRFWNTVISLKCFFAPAKLKKYKHHTCPLCYLPRVLLCHILVHTHKTQNYSHFQ